MKLLTKTSLLYLVVSLIVFSLTGCLIYSSLAEAISEEVDEELHRELAVTKGFLKECPHPESLDFPLLRLYPLAAPMQNEKEVIFSDSLYKEADGDEVEFAPYRVMRFEQQIGSQWYAVELSRAVVEKEDLSEAILNSLLVAAVVLSLLTVLVLAWLNKILWRPFYQTLDRIKSFDPSSKDRPRFPTTRTHEFAQLNRLLGDMAGQVQRDYHLLKAFTENASHELQTPIAIAQSKLEMLLQSPHLSAGDLDRVNGSLEALQRMKRINEGLLTLSKIENRQFADLEAIPFRSHIHKHVAAVSELAILKQVSLHFEALADPSPLLNSILADLLLGNLLSNAIRHNHTQGEVRIVLEATSFTISNTGGGKPLSKDRLFTRFHKGEAATMGNQGLGLGLAIVLEICTAMAMEIDYSFSNNLHQFKVWFPIQD